MTRVPDTATQLAFNAKITEEFRTNNGKVGAFEGAELVLLTTTGAKSGEPRLSPLSCRRVDGKLLIIAGYGGADINPAWVHNLRANSRAHVELAGESFDVSARELPPGERAAIIPKIAAIAPSFEKFQANTTRVIPVFELTRA